MTSMYDVLKASKGLPVDDIFAELWGRKLSSDYTIEVYTGTLPATITGTKAGYLHRYKIYGNTEQTGTPTPSDPIYPSECGERTENLLNEMEIRNNASINQSTGAVIASSATMLSDYIRVARGQTYIIKATVGGTLYSENRRPTGLYDEQKIYVGSSALTMVSPAEMVDGYKINIPSTLGSDTNYIRIGMDKAMTNIMLVEGSTALPYEPYGYKLPLTSAGQNVDIYLGDEPLRKIGDYADYIDYGTGKIVRQVRKIELTGNENFNKNSGSATNYLFYTPRITLTDSISKTSIVCDRLRTVGSPPASQIGINTINNYNMVYFNFGADIMNAQPSGNTIDGLKEYLAAQHTAGTPITIWYVLTAPVEEYPPIPFPQIPTTAGSTTISWAGEGLAPSEVEFEYERRR